MTPLGKAVGLTVKAAASAALAAAALAAWQYSSRANESFTDPAAAYVRYPGDALAASQAFKLRLSQDVSFALSDRDVANVRRGLIGRPLSPALLSFYAMRSELGGQSARASQAMLVADRVSRRDIISQVWLIENSVSRGDVTAAVRHYHAALSVRPELMPKLIPILAAALSFAEVRAAVRPYIASHAPWTPALLAQAVRVTAPADLEALVAPVAASLAPDEFGYPKSDIIAALAEDGKAQAGWALAAKMLPGFRAEVFRAPAFTPATADPRMGRLAWSLPQSDQITSTLTGGGGLSVQVSPLGRGLLAVRDVPVRAGASYQFLQSLAYDAGAPKAQLAWAADCVTRGGLGRVWEQIMPAAAGAVTFRSVIAVPADCHLLRLTASVTGADGQIPSTFKLKNLYITGK